MYKFIVNNNILTICSNNRIVNYKILNQILPVNEQQFNLPDGKKIEYDDGSKIIHAGDWCLLRHVEDNGNPVDRVAIHWNNLRVVC